MGEYNIWQSRTRSILHYITKMMEEEEIPYVITGGIAVQIYSYINNDKSFEERKTKDIDILVPKEYKTDIKYCLANRRIYFREHISKVRDTIEIPLENSPKISISFVKKLPDYETVRINKSSANVEKLESLLANKFSTYMFRSEEKDIVDICQIVKLLEKKGINLDSILNAMENYNIVEDAEKIFFIFLEKNGLIGSAKELIEFDKEEKEKIHEMLKGKKLICKE